MAEVVEVRAARKFILASTADVYAADNNRTTRTIPFRL
jgi:hypothetical protein